MSRDEVIKLLDKIKAYRQKFEINEVVMDEWYNRLEPYDYEDVLAKLNEYLSDLTNQGKYPDPIYLTKFLKTRYQKENTKEPTIVCSYCLKPIKYLEYKAHSERCSSVEWLCDKSKHYFLKKLDKKKLFEMDAVTFDKFYYEFSKKLYPRLPEGSLQQKVLDNVIKSYEGKPIGYSIEDLQNALEEQ